MKSQQDIKREYKERKKAAGVFQVWNEYGPDKFVFEILEVVKVKDASGFNLDDELTLLERIWIDKLQPFGERGYNTDSNIRQA